MKMWNVKTVYTTTFTTTSAGQEKIKMWKVYNANANNYDIGNVKDIKRNILSRQCHLSDKDNLGKTESY